MANQTYFQEIYSNPGITRDGTPFDSKTYVDGQWVRFYKDRPKKIGGYRQILNDSKEIIRSIASFSWMHKDYLVFGTYNSVIVREYNPTTMLASDTPETILDITPTDYLTDYPDDPNNPDLTLRKQNLWTFDFVSCEAITPVFTLSASYLPTSKINDFKFDPQANYLLAHVAPKLINVDNSTKGALYAIKIEDILNDKKTPDKPTLKLLPVKDYQSVLDKAGAPTSLTDPSLTTIEYSKVDTVRATGGVTVIGSYIFVYGNDGKIVWNNGKDLNCWSTQKPPTAVGTESKKILNTSIGGGITVIGSDNFIEGAPLRLGNSLGGGFWSTTSAGLMRLVDPGGVIIEGGTADNPARSTNVSFAFSYSSTLSTCISATSIVSAEPNFFWVGQDSFYCYNGAIEEVVNETNKLSFFNALNRKMQSKIYSFINFKYHEWWILFPRNKVGEDGEIIEATENNHALIYNYERRYWYDTALNRVAALRESGIIANPILSSWEAREVPKVVFNEEKQLNEATGETLTEYPVYLHEIGVNNVIIGEGAKELGISSFFKVIVSKELGQQISTRAVIIDRLIFDLNQVGNMDVTLEEYAYPRSNPAKTEIKLTPETESITLNNKATILGLTFSSNVRDGDYMMGKTLVEFIVTGDVKEQGTQKK